jgi:beta-glucosidase-like glycosyl hydrolase
VRVEPVAALARRAARQQVVLLQDSLGHLPLAVPLAAAEVVGQAAVAVVEQTHSTQ